MGNLINTRCLPVVLTGHRHVVEPCGQIRAECCDTNVPAVLTSELHSGVCDMFPQFIYDSGSNAWFASAACGDAIFIRLACENGSWTLTANDVLVWTGDATSCCPFLIEGEGSSILDTFVIEGDCS